ncbi:MAG: 3-deoxy-7-phosphoheptulonate synthase [Tenuifilaceae bacterium]|jgi:3-deoxy-7-phosphoheptulonate synthase|nr:3-deoxy-7-phosphoheptulonate synthase [Tenuifilaceae bacterium]
MLVQLDRNCSESTANTVFNQLTDLDLKPTRVTTNNGLYLICVGKKEVDIRSVGNMKGIKDVHIVDDDSPLVSSKWKVNPTTICLGNGINISRNDLTIAMGPCAIENEGQVEQVVAFLKENGIKIMRGGIFKPRSSPYAFRGLGIEGLKFFAQHCLANGIKVVSEVMQVSQIDEMYPYVDIFQVGTRNAQNFNLLDALGRLDKPILLKRGMSSTIQEFLASAEYIFSNGNERIILCERGIRTFEKMYRNTLDLNAIPLLKEKSHLPVFCDPSHGIGIREHVETMALSSVMAGADGVLMEIHPTPEKAYSDGQQTLNFFEAKKSIDRLKETSAIRKKLLYEIV